MSESVRGNQNLEELFQDLFHPNPNINQKAYMRITNYPSSKIIHALIGNLSNRDISIRRKSVKALGSFGQKAFSSLIKTFFANNDRVIRTSCLKVLVKVAADSPEVFFPDEVMNIVQLSLEDDFPELTLTAITILRQLGKQGLPLLINASQSKNLLMAAAAVTALSEIDDPLAKKCLHELLNDSTKDELLITSINEALSNSNR